MKRGADLPALGEYNQTLVLDLIRRAPNGVSRVELALQTGLSAQTLSNVTRRLIHNGLVREAGKAGSGPGKPRTMLQLESQARFAVGVHIDPTITTSVVIDLEGRLVARASSRTLQGSSPETTTASVAASVSSILEASGVERDRVLGVGIAFPGPLDASEGRIFDPPLLEGWHNVPLGANLEKLTGLSVHVEKDVTAATVAETWISGQSFSRNGLFFYYGTGVGAGLVVNGAVVRGASSNAGDIGHLVVDPDGPMCRCGRRGCLGDSISPSWMVNDAVRRGVLSRPRKPLDSAGIESGLAHLMSLAEKGEAEALGVVDAAARRIGRGVLQLASLLDFDEVIFGGPLWEPLGPIFLPIISNAILTDPASMMTHLVELRNSRFGVDIAAIGAGCVVLDRELGPSATNLLIDS